MAQVACTRCGDFVDESSALYSDTGDLVCPACNAKAEIASGDARAAQAIFAASGSSIALGAFAAVAVNPCYLVSILGILTAIGTFVLLHRHPEHHARLGWKLPATIAIAASGLLLSLVAPLVRLLIFALTGWNGFA
jgi:hypothetical protein